MRVIDLTLSHELRYAFFSERKNLAFQIQLPKTHSLSYLRPNIQQQVATMTYH